MATHDYYQILQVHQCASQAMIKAGYRTRLQKLKLKPKATENTDEQILIDEAYKVLSNPKTRTEYDFAYTSVATINNLKSTAYSHLQVNNQSLEQNIQQCPFCHHSQTSSLKRSHSAYVYCDQCGSPITLRSSTEYNHSKRHATRISLHDEISLSPSLHPDSQYAVQMKDVSIAGIAILSPQPLTPGERVQLSNQNLLGIAEVVHCNSDTLPHCCGLKFITVKHHKPGEHHL